MEIFVEFIFEVVKFAATLALGLLIGQASVNVKLTPLNEKVMQCENRAIELESAIKGLYEYERSKPKCEIEYETFRQKHI